MVVRLPREKSQIGSVVCPFGGTPDVLAHLGDIAGATVVCSFERVAVIPNYQLICMTYFFKLIE
jgi:hypothetical protein